MLVLVTSSVLRISYTKYRITQKNKAGFDTDYDGTQNNSLEIA